MCQLVSLYLLQVFSAAPEPNLQPPTQICEINCLPQTCGNHREVKLIKLLPKMISKDDIPTPGLGFLSCGQVGGVGVVWWGSGAFLVYVSCFYSGGWGMGRKELRVEAKKKPPKASNYGQIKWGLSFLTDTHVRAKQGWVLHSTPPQILSVCFTQHPTLVEGYHWGQCGQHTEPATEWRRPNSAPALTMPGRQAKVISLH